MSKPALYIASRTKHAQKWINLRNAGHNIVSSWIDEKVPIEDDRKKELAKKFVDEVCNCDYFILYCEKYDQLKDANVEYGIALGTNKKIIIIDPDFCNFLGHLLIHHPNVTVVFNLQNALQIAYNAGIDVVNKKSSY